MGGTMSSEAQMTLKLLDDLQWHGYEAVVQQVALTVPPGKALRKYNQVRDGMARRYGPRQSAELSEDDKIASGQRNYAVSAMNSLKERHLEFQGEGSEKQVRKRRVALLVGRGANTKQVCNVPEHEHYEKALEAGAVVSVAAPEESGVGPVGPEPCEPCGLYVSNAEQHAAFHEVFDEFLAGRTVQEPLPSSREMGLFDEAALRALIRQELEVVLASNFDRFQRGMQTFMVERFAALEEVLGAQIPSEQARRHRFR